MIRKKILLIGDFNVGKTSLIRRYVDNTFDDKYLTTIGVKISKKLVEIKEDACELLIWDVEGATAVKKIPIAYMKGASGAIFVGDVTRKETIESIENHIDIFLNINPDAHYVKAYNKIDALNASQKEELTLDEKSFFSSAKDDLNVAQLFEYLTKEMLG